MIGEPVVTSHISPNFLQGLLIGVISEINVDPTQLTRSGYITPAVDFSNLREVLIITTMKPVIDPADAIDPTAIE